MARTGLAYSEECLLHRAGVRHPERPERLTALISALEAAGLDLMRVDAAPAARADLLRVHTGEHIDAIQRTCGTGAYYPDPDTGMVEASWDAALMAAGAAIAGCRAVLNGEVDNVFCAVRPPGHHAERDRAMGFCLFNNVAVAARWLQAEGGLKRVAIIDWDVHHGNGTQQAFFDDSTVFYASLHQHPHFPGTGRPEERGAGNTNLNIQIARGAPAARWMEAMLEEVVPAVEAFAPDFLLLSAGFDAHWNDPLSIQELTAAHYAELTRLVRGLANGRVVSVLEGGYDLKGLGECALAHVRELQGGTFGNGVD